jgi:hypothetical protein
MRKIVLSAAALCLIATTAIAQNTPAQPGPQNQAVKGVHENNSMAPVKGANSFTRAEAKSQIEAKGYTRVTKLAKGKDGVWRGTAVKDGKKGPVSVDYQGNVN